MLGSKKKATKEKATKTKAAKKRTTKTKAAKKKRSTGRTVTISAGETKLIRAVARLESKTFDQVLADAVRHHYRDRMGVFSTQFAKGNR